MVLDPGSPPPSRLFRVSIEVKILLLIKPLFELCLASAQFTYLCYELLPGYAHAIAHLVLHGMYLIYEVTSYFAHVILYFRTYAFLQVFCSTITCSFASIFFIPLLTPN